MNRSRRSGGVGFLAGVAAACVAVLGTASPASAQFRGGPGMFRQMMEPSVNTAQLDRYAKMLDLTPDQRETVNEMLTGFQLEHQAIAAEIRETMEGARDEMRRNGDASVWRDVGQVMDRYRQRIKTIESAFFEDVQLLLTEDQAARWPSVERLRRRETTIDQGGIVSGETVDLVRLVEEAKLPAEAAKEVAPVLEQYEVDMDKALASRNEVYESGMRQGVEQWFGGDQAAVQKLFDAARIEAAKVRDVNRRYARQIEGLLPDEQRRVFVAAFREKSFPRVYGDAIVPRAVKITDELSDLTPEQREQVRAIAESYARDSSSINDRWAKAIEDHEMSRTAASMFGMGGRDDGTREMREARRTLDQTTMQKIRAVLTEEQRTRLPEPEERPDWRRRGGGGAGPMGPGPGGGNPGGDRQRVRRDRA